MDCNPGAGWVMGREVRGEGVYSFSFFPALTAPRHSPFPVGYIKSPPFQLSKSLSQRGTLSSQLHGHPASLPLT